jgi:hypothetical protein
MDDAVSYLIGLPLAEWQNGFEYVRKARNEVEAFF